MQKTFSPKAIALTFGVLVSLFSLGFYVFAWTEPSSGAPSGNADAPINVGSTGQTKTGNLVVNALGISGAGANILSIPYGAGAGKVLTSDSSGNASWQTLAAGGGGGGIGTTSATLNYLSKFTSGSAIGNSQIFDNGTSVGIGTASPHGVFNISSSLPNIYFTNTNAPSGQKNWELGLSGNNSFALTQWNDTWTTGAEMFNFDNSSIPIKTYFPSGPVAIGTIGATPPAAVLDVRNAYGMDTANFQSNANSVVNIVSAGSSWNSTLNIQSGTGKWGLSVGPSSENLVIGRISGSGNLVVSSGNVNIGSLAGSGTRMVTADASGNLSSQAIPSGGGSGTIGAIFTYGTDNFTSYYTAMGVGGSCGGSAVGGYGGVTVAFNNGSLAVATTSAYAHNSCNASCGGTTVTTFNCNGLSGYSFHTSQVSAFSTPVTCYNGAQTNLISYTYLGFCIKN